VNRKGLPAKPVIRQKGTLIMRHPGVTGLRKRHGLLTILMRQPPAIGKDQDGKNLTAWIRRFAARRPLGKPGTCRSGGIFLAGLSSQAPSVQTSAFVSIRSWSFTKPVYSGDRVHVVTEVLDLKPHGRRHGEVHWYRQLINQDGQKVQEGILVTLVSRRVPLSLQRSRIGEMNRSDRSHSEIGPHEMGARDRNESESGISETNSPQSVSI